MTQGLGSSSDATWRDLERRMQPLAEDEGSVIIPNPLTRIPADFVLVAMEPSLDRWVKSVEQGQRRVAEGFKNFLHSLEDFILHYCADRYLCRGRACYYITDLSKGAMLVEQAQRERMARYERWFPILQQELHGVATQQAPVIAVGKVVGSFLGKKRLDRPVHTIPHYSGANTRRWKTYAEARRDLYATFRGEVKIDDIADFAEAMMAELPMSNLQREEAMARLRHSTLAESRQQLLFTYKTEFERIRRELDGDPAGAAP